MDLIDSHCHLEMPHFDADREEVIRRAVAAGVTRMITVATNLEDARKAAAITQAHPEVFLALGFHPHDAKSSSEEAIREMMALAKSPRVVAWGEIGLDYHYDHSPRHIQRNVFAEQIYLARELGLPLIIHCRDANNDTLGILENETEDNYRGVFHCFSGDIEMAGRVLDLGFRIGFTGTITFAKNVMAAQVIKFAGLENILIETDCPYLAPAPHRGKRNEPANVVHVAQRLSEILGFTPEEVAEKTVGNTLDLFPRLTSCP